jgi:phosphate acetyltransferase
MTFKEKILSKVKKTPRRLVLPEGDDIRVLKAAEMIIKEKITSELYVLGNVEKLKRTAGIENININGVKLLDPEESPNLKKYSNQFYVMRKHKGVSPEVALETMKDVVYYGAMMLKMGDVDAMVSGSLTPTAKTVRASLIIVQPKEGIQTVSGSFVMIVPNTEYGNKGQFVYADCGVVPEPTSEQLSDIAISSAETAKKLLEVNPVVAFLSFSTMGSGDSMSVKKVRKAVELLKDKKPDFLFDGELQFDAAVDSTVAKLKAPSSIAAGKSNVMIFPDLNAGNIAYKITQRLCNAEAYGPLLQGLSRPVNDLSRGATPEDILMVSAITIAQSI